MCCCALPTNADQHDARVISGLLCVLCDRIVCDYLGAFDCDGTVFDMTMCTSVMMASVFSEGSGVMAATTVLMEVTRELRTVVSQFLCVVVTFLTDIHKLCFPN